MTVYVSIGNSDDKLCQVDWAGFVDQVGYAVRLESTVVHGAWLSGAADPWQNACWCFEVEPKDVNRLKATMRRLATTYGQDSIAWAEVPVTEFLAAHDVH
jgi:hypothetical protein